MDGFKLCIDEFSHISCHVHLQKANNFVGPDGKTYKFSDDYKFTLDSVCETSDFFSLPPILDNVPSEFLVLSSIAGESEVAGYKVNLLRFCTLDSKTAGERVCLRFGADRVYVPLADNYIKEIHTELRSLDNSLLNLKGFVRALLHIRQKKT